MEPHSDSNCICVLVYLEGARGTQFPHLMRANTHLLVDSCI